MFKNELTSAKSSFYKKQISDLKTKKPGQWYSSLKRLSSYDQNKSVPLFVQEISHLSPQRQAEAIADHFSSIANQYEPLSNSDISIPPYSPSKIPQFPVSDIWLHLTKL